ncbi:MAG: hypothetical protein KGL39_49645 [Patescibacteria group bacterium]|nr:hypothetical protein [Patescibacteria group bacterium]
MKTIEKRLAKRQELTNLYARGLCDFPFYKEEPAPQNVANQWKDGN